MIKAYLKTKDEAELIKSLSFARVTSEDGEGWLRNTHDYSLDIVGTIYNDDAVTDAAGEIVTPATSMSGFHANIICSPEVISKIPSELFIPAPKHPKRTWS